MILDLKSFLPDISQIDCPAESFFDPALILYREFRCEAAEEI